jgi:hypothetical protein
MKLKPYQDDWGGRLVGTITPQDTDSPLQLAFHEMRERMLAADKEAGNGGLEVLETTVDYISRKPDYERFTGLREYLDYRYIDAAML